MAQKYDVIVAGGGIVGLATALRFLEMRPGSKLLLIEKENILAKHQTGHNSGVIHSGIYYKPGSLKALNCLRGYKMLLEFCDANQVTYDLCGKVIVATDKNELPELEKLYKRGLENGLADIRKIGTEELKEREPHVNGIEAIWVPYTGIIDYTQVCERISRLIDGIGGEIKLGRAVERVWDEKRETIVKAEGEEYKTSLFINCTGLQSDRTARNSGLIPDTRIIPFRGEYFKIKDERKHLVKNLIYPVPDPNFPFLGVHFTRMIGGAVEAGPNAVWAWKREGYEKTGWNLGDMMSDLAWPGFRKVMFKYWRTGMGEMYRSVSKSAFTKALQRLVPEIQADDLIPAGAGVRAQACDRQGGLLDDFKILEEERHIHVLNAPSPAATSSLSIGRSVAEMAIKRFD